MGVAGDLDASGEEDPLSELDLSTGKKEAFVVDVSAHKVLVPSV